MSKELIRLRDLVMEFDGERILDGINLYINDHEFLTLLGPSGCGKSTTLRIIGGFLTPTSGTVTFDGQVINDVPPYKRQINTVFQRYALFPHLDVYDNVAFGLRLKKMPKEEIDRRVREMLEVVSLKGYENRSINALSGGQQQRVAIARALINEPKNAFVADFIGESNILDGVMLADYKVKFFGRTFKCLDAGFAPNEPVDVVIRPEDIDFVPVEEGHLTGTVTSVTFKGLNYDIIVDFKGFKWLIQTTDFQPVGATVGIRLNPEDIHIMHKSEYSGMFGDYSSYSAEYDELAEDAGDEEE